MVNSECSIKRGHRLKTIMFLFAAISSLHANAAEIESQKYSLSANYQLNAQNPEGTNPTSTVSLTLSPSLILNDVHEIGGTINCSVSKSENTLASTTSEVSTTMLSGFYRFNLTFTEAGAKIPIVGYAGPQAGITSFKAAGKSISDPSAGAQFGLNLMFSEHLALNLHLFQFDTVFSDDMQLLLTQSIGVKYYF